MTCKNPHPFLKIFPPVFIPILRFCGMLPFSYTIQYDWKLTGYSILLLSICFFIKATTISVVNSTDKVNVEEVMHISRALIISRFVRIIYPIIKTTIPFVAIFNALWKRRFMYKFCNSVSKSDELVNCEELTRLVDKKMKLATKVVVWCLVVSLIAKFCSVLSLVFLKEVKDWQVMLWVVLLYSMDTVGLVTEIQFVLMSLALRTRFLQVNNRLKRLFSERDSNAEVRIQKFAEEWGNEKYSLEVVENSRNKFTNTSLPSYKFHNHSIETAMTLFEKEFLAVQQKHVEAAESELVKCLKCLRLRHRYLCAALHQLTLMFEYVLLISIFSLFLMILLNVYSAIFGLARDLLFSHAWNTCFWLVSSLVRLVCPLAVTDSLVDQARRTVELLSTFASRDLSNNSLKELQEFSHEVESRKLTVTCAFNLFTVKTGLLTSAVAAGTTYIVTLIQLH